MAQPIKKNIYIKLDPIKPSKAYDAYWSFAYKRQEIFYKRIGGKNYNLTDDNVLRKYKFTNVYRACDRTSQFLIKDVIYSGPQSEKEIFFRIILFKLFNKIDTWKLLEKEYGCITTEIFNLDKIKKFLDKKMEQGIRLYSNAYMMASGSKEFKVTRKHHAHLLLIEKMLKDRLYLRISGTRKMKEGFDLLCGYPLIGNFLAYQYITDINYSTITNYSESEFTIAGPGARDGIKKCFESTGGLSESELIRFMTDIQEQEFSKLNLDFKYLLGRRMQYIDIQNVFCEVDKYCRVAYPEIKGHSDRTKIKQLYKPNQSNIEYYYPPKWDINKYLNQVNLYGY